MSLGSRANRIVFQIVITLFLGIVAVSAAFASNDLQQQYDAAEHAQAAGDMSLAAQEYKKFLSDALDTLAKMNQEIGATGKSLELFDEAVALAPGNVQLLIDYAEAARVAGDLQKSKLLALEAANVNPHSAAAHLELGKILLLMNQSEQAKTELEAAVAIDSNYADGLALARAYLQLKNEKSSDQLFTEMLKAYGDHASIRLDFGLAYAESGYSEQAIGEFKKAIAENSKLSGAHYSLGAAYLQRMGEIDFPKAEKEFQDELKISPNDVLSYTQLGYIELSQHRYAEAEIALKRASILNPKDPDIFLSLGQLYVDVKKPLDAETALRISISLTSDVSRNHYQVQRAHYLLGRLLLETGHPSEAKTEMQIAAQLLQQNSQQTQGKSVKANLGMTIKPVSPWNDNDKGVNSSAIAQEMDFEKRIGPAIADSYNNLGAISAKNKNYSEALSYFKDAQKWNPSLDGLDYNLGRAAYAMGEYAQAVPPLQQYLLAHPDSLGARSILSICQYQQKNYSDVVVILQPIQEHIQSIPALEEIYMDSLEKSRTHSPDATQENP